MVSLSFCLKDDDDQDFVLWKCTTVSSSNQWKKIKKWPDGIVALQPRLFDKNMIMRAVTTNSIIKSQLKNNPHYCFSFLRIPYQSFLLSVVIWRVVWILKASSTDIGIRMRDRPVRPSFCQSRTAIITDRNSQAGVWWCKKFLLAWRPQEVV